MFKGSIICFYLFQPSIVGIMVCLEVFIVCLMVCFDCWGYWHHVMSREVDDYD